VKRLDVIEQLAALRTDELVVSTMGVTATEWLVTTGDHESTFYMKGAMGMVSSFALGLALALPDRQVWALDGDGSLAMNLNSFLTTADQQPPNMIHFLFSNRCYETSGQLPLVNAERTDFAGIAKAAGIESVYDFRETETFRSSIADIAGARRYAFVNLEVETTTAKYATAPSEPIEMSYRFGRHIERTSSVKVFGV
jgi:thiamine pyrophosphate-dependent acetolactate synthase large subunit-like protein